MNEREFCKLLLNVIDNWEEEYFDGDFDEPPTTSEWIDLVKMMYEEVKGKTIE